MYYCTIVVEHILEVLDSSTIVLNHDKWPRTSKYRKSAANKCPIETRELLEKILFWAGSLGELCVVNLKKSVVQKLRRIILLHVGLVIFRSHFGNTRKTLHVWGFLDFGTRPWFPKPIRFNIGSTKILQPIEEQIRNDLSRILFELSKSCTPTILMFWGRIGPGTSGCSVE